MPCGRCRNEDGMKQTPSIGAKRLDAEKASMEYFLRDYILICVHFPFLNRMDAKVKREI